MLLNYFVDFYKIGIHIHETVAKYHSNAEYNAVEKMFLVRSWFNFLPPERSIVWKMSSL